MSYNGSGTFQINTTGQPVVTGTVISSTAFNALTADLATGLSTAITKDGQTATTVRIPFAAGINSSLATDSSSTSTGSIITAGGVGIAKSLYVGTNLNYGGVTLTNAVTGTGKMVLDTSPTLVTPALGTPASGVLTNCTGVQYTSFKNRIINGAMVIDQRNAGASVTPTGDGTYTLDRWQFSLSAASKFSTQQSSTAPTGFINSNLITSLSAYSVPAGGYFMFNQPIEGLNVSDLAWGTASAATVTLSFWVRSSLTGTFGGAIQNSAQNRSYPFSYTISTANIFEQKTVTIAGDTSGTWLTTNGVGIILRFGLGVGSTYSNTAGAWAAGQYFSSTGATSVVGTNGATFYITGVQLEKGSTATSFDYRPYGTELALCQRYFISYGGEANYERFGNCVNTSTTQAIGMVSFPIQMRSAPSITSSGPLGLYNGSATTAVTSIAVDQAASKVTSIAFSVASGLSANAFTQLIANNSTATRLTFSAEL